MSATSHNAPRTKSCALVLGASSKDLRVSEKLRMNNACEGGLVLGVAGWRAGRGLRSPEQINPSRVVIVVRLREQTPTPRLDLVMFLG